MPFCSATCQKWTLFGFSIFFLIFGITLVVFTDDIVNTIVKQELNLGSKDTTEFKFWEVTPIPMYIELYLFNWTNWKEVVDSKWTKKPEFQQTGPYTYREIHYRKRVIFNDNHTLTYQTQRIWHFEPDMTKGSLDDLITTINPILASVGAFVKNKHAIVRMGVNFLMEEKKINLTVTKTVREFLFDGYDDPLLDLLKKLRLRHLNMPFKKFGWYAERNGSIEFDGIYNMYDGTDDVRKLGRFTAWNYNTTTEYYPGSCGKIKGTSGELWYPVMDDESIEVFSPDLCSTLFLTRNGEKEIYGVKGHRYVGDKKTFDNGTIYPEMSCFNPIEIPKGVRNVSECKYGAPAFVSFPHFYLADPYYRNAIIGMRPNETEHTLSISIEPKTGIPLEARVPAQINLRVESVDRINLLENVKLTYIPALWFKQYALLNEELANQAKLILMLPSIGQYTGYGLIGLSCLFLFAFGFIVWINYRKGSEEEGLLNQDAL